MVGGLGGGGGVGRRSTAKPSTLVPREKCVHARVRVCVRYPFALQRYTLRRILINTCHAALYTVDVPPR